MSPASLSQRQVDELGGLFRSLRKWTLTMGHPNSRPLPTGDSSSQAAPQLRAGRVPG